MTDLPALKGVTDTWREPVLADGRQTPVSPRMVYDGGQAGHFTFRAASIMAEGVRPPLAGRTSFAAVDLPAVEVALLLVVSADGPAFGPAWAARYATSVAAVALEDRVSSAEYPHLEEAAQLILGDIAVSVLNNIVAAGHAPLLRLDVGLALVPTNVGPAGTVDVAVAARGWPSIWSGSGGNLDELLLIDTDDRAQDDPLGQPSWRGVKTLRAGELLIVANPEFLNSRPSALQPFLGSTFAVAPTPIEFLKAVSVRHESGQRDRAVVVAWCGQFEERA